VALNRHEDALESFAAAIALLGPQAQAPSIMRPQSYYHPVRSICSTHPL
jgi:hypothetical protein